MTLFDIIQNNKAKAIAVSDYLIKNKYAIQTRIDANRLLNSSIKKEIIENFYLPEMVTNATPISYINEAFGKLLRINIKAI